MEISDYRRIEGIPRGPHKKGEYLVDDDMGEVICRCCGEVLEERIVSYDGGKKSDISNERGSSHNAPESSAPTSTVIGNRDFHGKPVNKSIVNKLIETDGRSDLRIKRHTLQNTQIQNLLQKHNTLKFKPDVLKRYNDALSMKLNAGRSNASLIGAITCSVYRENGIPFTFKEMANDLDITKKELSNTYRAVYNVLELSIVPKGADSYVYKITSNLDISPERKEMYSRKTSNVVAAYRDKAGPEFSGKSPVAIAASALYVVKEVLKDNSLNQVKISDASDTSTVTIRNRGKDIMKTLGDSLYEIVKK